MARDPRLEAWLDRLGVRWQYHPTIDLQTIDREYSRHNSGRLGKPLVDETVEKYARDMREAPDAFPALLGHAHGSLWRLEGGLHRDAAAQAIDRQTFDLYEVLSKDEYVLEMIARGANQLEGMGLTEEDRLLHAKELHRKYGRPIREVAERFGLNAGELARSLRVDTVLDRLSILGVKGGPVHFTTLEKLHKIRTDSVLAAATRVVVGAALTADQVGQLTDEIERERSERAQLAIVYEWQNRPEILSRVVKTQKGTRFVEREPKSGLFRALTTAIHMIERYPTAALLHLTGPEDKRRLEELWDTLTDLLSPICREDAA